MGDNTASRESSSVYTARNSGACELISGTSLVPGDTFYSIFGGDFWYLRHPKNGSLTHVTPAGQWYEFCDEAK
jgi:hypothetical protein